MGGCLFGSQSVVRGSTCPKCRKIVQIPEFDPNPNLSPNPNRNRNPNPMPI